MMITVILFLLFASISLVAFITMRSSTDAWDQYSDELSATTESNMRKLFLFADTRKLLIAYVIGIIVVPLLLLLVGFSVPVIVAVLIAVVAAPRLMFAHLSRLRKIKINEALPDALAQIAGAMSAGSTFSVAMQVLVDESSGPLSQEFSLLLREQRIGARLEDALDNLAERVQTEEMDLVVSAALIAHDVGGNLAEILHSLADTIRRKLEMEGKVQSLTAQGRLQGHVVTALPFMILGVLTLIEPDATLPIFNTLLGWIFLSVIVVLLCIGGLMIRKIVNIDI